MNIDVVMDAGLEEEYGTREGEVDDEERDVVDDDGEEPEEER